jgi:hypothetical protein
MPRKSKRKKRAEVVSRMLESHLTHLRINSISDYKAWCKEHGFSQGLNKSWAQFQRERLVPKREAAERALVESRKEKKPRKIIEKIFSGEVTHVKRPALNTILQETKRFDPVIKDALMRVILHIDDLTDFLDEKLTFHFGKVDILDGLLNIAKFYRHWQRPIEDWKPRTHNTRRQFSSFVRHLMAKYDVPTFMDSVWFKKNKTHQRWFLHIGLGGNIRKAKKLPVELTKKMAHNFLQAPNDYSVEGALRWGQVHGLGGNALLANTLLTTRLCEDIVNDDFWIGVIHFFINNPMLDMVHVGPIIDYVHNQKYAPQEVFVEEGVIQRRGPAQPDFSMKGRSVNVLLTQVGAWHRDLAKAAKAPRRWVKCGIKPFEFVEGKDRNQKRWTITELLNSHALQQEGKAMKHCVGSYSSSCANGSKSIWSMKCEKDVTGPKRVLTIAVGSRTKSITEARGHCNEKPGINELKILRRWAVKEELVLSDYI